MKIETYNGIITIHQPDSKIKNMLSKALSYCDKSKLFRLKKMEKNPFMRSSSEYVKLKNEVHGNLLQENKDGSISCPIGFIHLLEKYGSEIISHRKETGSTIVIPWLDEPFALRDYQLEALEVMKTNYRGLINFSTGLGKTLLAIHVVHHFKKKTLIVCPGKEIAEQFYKQLRSAFGDQKVGFLGDGKDKISLITVGIAATVNNKIEKLKNADLGLIIFDEVHHIAANTFFNIATHLGDVGRIYGLTATDFRQDGKDIFITACVGSVLVKRDLIWGIQTGWLADPSFLIRRVKTTGPEFKDDKLKNYKEHVLNSKQMNARLISDINSMITAGKKVLCLVDEVSHGNLLAKATGLPFATGVDKDSSLYIELLNRGKVPGLIGTTGKVGEGVDTRLVDVLILANFVASKGILWQSLGRGLRLYPGKTKLLVLDYIPNGSSMLRRHANLRVQYYQEITDKVKILGE